MIFVKMYTNSTFLLLRGYMGRIGRVYYGHRPASPNFLTPCYYSAECISRTCPAGDSDPKTARSNRCIEGKPQGLRVPILTFTKGDSNGKIFGCLSVYIVCVSGARFAAMNGCEAFRSAISLQRGLTLCRVSLRRSLLFVIWLHQECPWV